MFNSNAETEDIGGGGTGTARYCHFNGGTNSCNNSGVAGINESKQPSKLKRAEQCV